MGYGLTRVRWAFGLKAENCVLEGRQERKVGQEGALRPTRPLGSVDRSSAWYDPHYRRVGLLRNAFAANWPNSAAVDEGASPASAAQIGQQTSGLCDAVRLRPLLHRSGLHGLVPKQLCFQFFFAQAFRQRPTDPGCHRPFQILVDSCPAPFRNCVRSGAAPTPTRNSTAGLPSFSAWTFS